MIALQLTKILEWQKTANSAQNYQDRMIFVNKLIENGIQNTKCSFEDDVLGIISPECTVELRDIHEETLNKAGLANFIKYRCYLFYEFQKDKLEK